MTRNVFINRRIFTVLFSIIGTTVISFFNIANVETVTTVDDNNNRMTKLLEYRAEKTIKVLIARTVSPTEVDNVLADVNRILSYSHPSNHERYLSASLSQCSSFHNDSSTIDLFNGSDTFPNYILCDVNRTQGNNYYTVKADFLLFARNKDVVEQLAIYNENITIDEEDKINVLDVTNSPVKLWNWIAHLTEERLYYFDYVWMVDGDIQMSSLNWHSYWQIVKIIRPMVVQPAIIGTGPNAFSSNHPVMRQHGDRRVVAAETAIVEMMVPMLEVDTWLGYRNVIASQPPLTQHLQRGGEDCFDISWCHYARANLTGEQLWPPNGISFNPSRSRYTSQDNYTHGTFKKRSCVVLYQNPIVHGNKRTLVRNRKYRSSGQAICQFMRENYHIHWAVKSVYDLFVAYS